MQSRANQLISSQPALAGFLSGNGGGGFAADVTKGAGVFNFAQGEIAFCQQQMSFQHIPRLIFFRQLGGADQAGFFYTSRIQFVQLVAIKTLGMKINGQPHYFWNHFNN